MRERASERERVRDSVAETETSTKAFPAGHTTRTLAGHLEIFLEHYKYCMAEAINPHFGEEREKILFYQIV